MVQFSFGPPNADHLGFTATPEAILESACTVEELGFDTENLDRLLVTMAMFMREVKPLVER
jgi:hypothetical protein